METWHKTAMYSKSGNTSTVSISSRLYNLSFEFIRLAAGIYHFGQNEEVLSRRISEILLQMNVFSVFYLSAFTAYFVYASSKKTEKSVKRE